jgi:hypothetical protein
MNILRRQLLKGMMAGTALAATSFLSGDGIERVVQVDPLPPPRTFDEIVDLAGKYGYEEAGRYDPERTKSPKVILASLFHKSKEDIFRNLNAARAILQRGDMFCPEMFDDQLEKHIVKAVQEYAEKYSFDASTFLAFMEQGKKMNERDEKGYRRKAIQVAEKTGAQLTSIDNLALSGLQYFIKRDKQKRIKNDDETLKKVKELGWERTYTMKESVQDLVPKAKGQIYVLAGGTHFGLYPSWESPLITPALQEDKTSYIVLQNTEAKRIIR